MKWTERDVRIAKNTLNVQKKRAKETLTEGQVELDVSGGSS